VSDVPSTSLQESILAALVFDERAGTTIAAQVTPAHFDESYREIAERVLAYRRKYGHAPGRAHLDDLFDKRLTENNRPSRVRRLLLDLAGIAPELNGEYIVSRTQQFVWEQQIKASLVEANARWEQGGDTVAPEIAGILHKALKFRATTFDAGTFLNDSARALRFLDRDTDASSLSFGIPELEAAQIRMHPKEMTLYIAGKGTGKSWACVHIGRQAIKSGTRRVLHITNEMSEELVTRRYIQSVFAVATQGDVFEQTFFEFRNNEKKDVLKDIYQRKVRPTLNFNTPSIRTELRQRMKSWGTKFGRLVIKEFASGALTVAELESYLDYLDQEHKFQPNILIVDYPDLMAQDIKNYRISVGRTFVALRGLLKERNMAGFFPTQSNRLSLRASKVSADMVAEDISKLNTADTVMTYSRTEAEKELNLARLYVSNARNQRDGKTIVLSQSYNIGQYYLNSMPLVAAYWDIIKGQDEEDEA
jgi:hypothetical protein